MTIRYKKFDKDKRPWGTWEVLDTGTNYIVKKITVLPKQCLSLQLHHFRNEHWIIAEGEALVTLGEARKIHHANDAIYIPVKTKHRIENPSDNPLIFIEVQTGENLDENDIVRFEDIYNRVHS